jgi:hypothetical protein
MPWGIKTYRPINTSKTIDRIINVFPLRKLPTILHQIITAEMLHAKIIGMILINNNRAIHSITISQIKILNKTMNLNLDKTILDSLPRLLETIKANPGRISSNRDMSQITEIRAPAISSRETLTKSRGDLKEDLTEKNLMIDKMKIIGRMPIPDTEATNKTIETTTSHQIETTIKLTREVIKIEINLDLRTTSSDQTSPSTRGMIAGGEEVEVVIEAETEAEDEAGEEAER